MTAALEGSEWSAACPGRTLPPGKTRYPFYRRLGDYIDTYNIYYIYSYIHTYIHPYIYTTAMSDLNHTAGRYRVLSIIFDWYVLFSITVDTYLLVSIVNHILEPKFMSGGK